MLHDFFGWLGSACFAVSAVPQAFKSYKDKHSDGMSWGMIILCLLGETCSVAYTIPLKLLPLTLNYACNFVFCSVILYYKVFPKEKL